jgi:hypothetical protein
MIFPVFPVACLQIWKRLSIVSSAPIALLFVLALVSIETPASAREYCRMDASGHMTGCIFDNMEQCEWMRSGIHGDCFRDPFLPPADSIAKRRKIKLHYVNDKK